jgi:uncharacterized membrane protein HdeD (DUF308 family)
MQNDPFMQLIAENYYLIVAALAVGIINFVRAHKKHVDDLNYKSLLRYIIIVGAGFYAIGVATLAVYGRGDSFSSYLMLACMAEAFVIVAIILPRVAKPSSVLPRIY